MHLSLIDADMLWELFFTLTTFTYIMQLFYFVMITITLTEITKCFKSKWEYLFLLIPLAWIYFVSKQVRKALSQF